MIVDAKNTSRRINLSNYAEQRWRQASARNIERIAGTFFGIHVVGGLPI
jgi:hypothetical protein